MVNELRGGLTAYASGSNFGYPSSITSRNDPSTFADSGGFAITTPGNTTDWFTSNTPSWRKAPTYSVEDTLTWNKGAHTILTGGNVFISNASSSGQTMVRGITLGFNQDFDPAAGLFNTTNFPGASSDQLTAARDTYARADRPCGHRDQHGRPSEHGPVPRSLRRARSKAATKSSACSRRIRGG